MSIRGVGQNYDQGNMTETKSESRQFNREMAAKKYEEQLRVEY